MGKTDKKKIIIAGAGKAGWLLTKLLLKENYEIILIDTKQEVLGQIIEQYDVMTVCGNAATKAVLVQSEIMSASLFIAMTGADETNLLACMTAHHLNPNLKTIARVRNPEYYEQIHDMYEKYGLSYVVNPEQKTAKRVGNLLRYPGFLKRETFAKDKMEIVELKIEDGSKLDGTKISDFGSVTKCKVLVCVVVRDQEVIMPKGDFVLKKEDRLYVTAAKGILSQLLKNLGIITKKNHKILIAGGGKISYYLAEDLIGSGKHGVEVSIIEKDPERAKHIAEKFEHVAVIHGDASDQNLLEGESFDQYDALVSMTGMDELNVLISLYGNDKGISQIITQLDHTQDNRIIDHLPIGSVICPKEFCCNSIIRYVRAMDHAEGAAKSVHSIAGNKAEALEFEINDSTKNVGVPLKSMKIKKNVLIAGIMHGEKVTIPDGDSTFAKGDRVIVVTNELLPEFNGIFV